MLCNAVSGFTIASEDRQSLQTRENQTQSKRSDEYIPGRFTDSELVTQRNVLKLDSGSAF